jgi:hypothetical protein
VVSGPTSEFELEVEKWKTYLFYLGSTAHIASAIES